MMCSTVAAALGQARPEGSPSTRETPAKALAPVVFQNVRVFDGKSEKLSGLSHVLIRGNRIERVSSTPIAADPRAETVVIDGGGRTLMPGLIDVHWHAMFVRPTPATLMEADAGYVNLLAGAEASDTLLRGFTDRKSTRLNSSHL